MPLRNIGMRALSVILKDVNELSNLACVNAQYWIDVNLGLKKGFELPVPQQNILDDINGSFTEQFRNQEVNVRELDQVKFGELLSQVDLTALGGFISLAGIDHHYHVNTGVGDNNFHLKVDLKCIPTVMDEQHNPVGSICFISGEINIGDAVFSSVTIKYIGPNSLFDLHHLIVGYGMRATNQELGDWLRFMRSLTHKEHLILLSHQKEIH